MLIETGKIRIMINNVYLAIPKECRVWCCGHSESISGESDTDDGRGRNLVSNCAHPLPVETKSQ